MSSPQHRLREVERLRDEGLVTDVEYETRRSAVIEELTGGAPPLGTRAFRWGLFGCLGVAAAVGVLVMGLIALGAILVFSYDGGDVGDRPAEEPDVRMAFVEGSSAVVETLEDVGNRVSIVRIVDPDVDGSRGRVAPSGYHLVSVEVKLERIGERRIIGVGGGDFGSSFTLRTSDAADREPSVITAVLTFEAPDGSTTEWLRFNPNLFVGSLYFDAPRASP